MASRRVGLLSVLFFLFMASLAFNLVLLNKPTDLSSFLPKAENSSISEYVFKIVDLTNEGEPTIAEVKDAVNLKKEDGLLYKNILNGDKILIYTDTIVIFRPLTGKIIQVVKIPQEEQEPKAVE